MLSFLSIKTWLAVGVAAAFLALGGAWWVRGTQLKDARADIKTLEADVEIAKKTIAAQQSALKECSDRTDALKRESDKKVSDANEAVLRARDEAKRYVDANKRRATLLAAPSPPGAGCREAVTSIRKDLKP